MARLSLIETTTSTGKAKELLDGVHANLGRVPNMMRAMVNSPVVLEIYLSVNTILSRGMLTPELRELLAITVAQANQCEYCLSAHTARGKKLGLDSETLITAQRSKASDPKIGAALNFARLLIEKNGDVSDEEITAVRAKGYSDGEIAEIVAVTTFNIFPNYFNKVAETALDFPKAGLM